MTYTYTRVRREPSLEELAATVISLAASFAESYARSGPVPKGYHRRTLPHMLERFAQGDVLDERDNACMTALGDVLKAAVDAIAPGHADVILSGDVPEGSYFNQDLQNCRDHLVAWQDFNSRRNALRCRVMARALLAEC